MGFIPVSITLTIKKTRTGWQCYVRVQLYVSETGWEFALPTHSANIIFTCQKHKRAGYSAQSAA